MWQVTVAKFLGRKMACPDGLKHVSRIQIRTIRNLVEVQVEKFEQMVEAKTEAVVLWIIHRCCRDSQSQNLPSPSGTTAEEYRTCHSELAYYLKKVVEIRQTSCRSDAQKVNMCAEHLII